MAVLIEGINRPTETRKCKFFDIDPLGVRKPFCAIQSVCDGLESCPLIEVDRMNDKITLKDAIETHAWTMLYAAEPTRPVDVTMSYADLWAIYKWITESIPESGDSDV